MQRLIVIGTSAGGLEALKQLVAALPAGLPAAVLIVMHIGAHRSELPDLLARHSALPVRHARDGEAVDDGTVLIAPPDRHLMLARSGRTLQVTLSHGPKENHTRPAIDPLFRSAAEVAGAAVVGVVLTGYLDDGSVGLKAVKECGGVAVVQDPADASAPDMPANALRHVQADYCVPLRDIGPLLARLGQGDIPAPVTVPQAAVPRWIKVENSFARSMGNMQELIKIGAPSPFTCPDCNGTLWRVGDAPPHFRCHTGHAFSVQTLLALQDQMTEQALWSGVRALQEKAGLAQLLASEAAAGGQSDAGYAAMAQQAQQAADSLKAMLTDDKLV